jgi:hypothetical protein
MTIPGIDAGPRGVCNLYGVLSVAVERPLGEGPMAARKKAAKKKTARRKAAKRELIDTGTNKLFVRRNKRGTSFKEVEDVGRSLTQDRRRKAKTVAKRGQGDRGDRRR